MTLDDNLWSPCARLYTTAPISDADRLMLGLRGDADQGRHADRADDHEQLRAAGFDDRAILQITLIASWFNYINRLRAERARAPARHARAAGDFLISAILAFVQAADTTVDAMNSFMLVRHGRVVAEGWWGPYDAQTPHVLYSLSKSFTSTAVGLAIAEGKLSLDDEVLKFFPADAPAQPSANLRAMRVRDLLRMSTGHQTEATFITAADSTLRDATWIKRILAHPVPFKPGTHFLYNSPATYMLSAIVQKVTGQTVLDYLRPRIFEPLGIENPTWVASPQGISAGAYGLNVRTEDIARLGQLYLQKGCGRGGS